MKKRPVQWILIVLAAVCILFAGITCVRAMKQAKAVQEKFDKAQISVVNDKEEIENIQQKQEEAQKTARQKALDEKKEKEAQEQVQMQETEGSEDSEKGKEESEEAETEKAVETEEAEETINSFEQTSNGRIVGIDPGHQGSWVDMSALEPNAPGSSQMKARCTTGTTGNYTHLEEYQLNLDVSLKLKSILESRGYQVVMTREDNDANISNAERAQKVAAAGAEIYVRVHANSSEDSSVSGALTMCPSPQNPYVGNLYEQSYRLSEVILNTYCEATGFGNRGVMITDTMTGINWSTIPVTIIEMGFMSNQSDDTTMADSTFQNQMAEGIANGIDAYFAGN